MVHFGCATLEIIVLEEGLASYRLFCINAVSLEQATHIRPVLSVAVSAPQWWGWAVAMETVRCSKPKLFTLWFSTEKRCHLCCRKWTKLWGPGCVAYSLHSIHSLAQTGALCSVQVARGLLRGRVSRAVSRQCNSGQGSGPGSDSPHRLHSRTQLQLELDGNQRQSGNVNIWAYLYRSVLVAGFDGKHHYPFFLPRSVLKW